MLIGTLLHAAGKHHIRRPKRSIFRGGKDLRHQAALRIKPLHHALCRFRLLRKNGKAVHLISQRGKHPPPDMRLAPCQKKCRFLRISALPAQCLCRTCEGKKLCQPAPLGKGKPFSGKFSLGRRHNDGGTRFLQGCQKAHRPPSPICCQYGCPLCLQNACQYPVHSCQCVRVSVHCFSLSPPLRQQLCPLRKDRLLPLFQKSHSCRFHALFPLFR